MFKSIILILLTSLLSACASAPALAPTGVADLTTKLAQFRKDTSLGLISPDDLKILGSINNNPGQTQHDGIREYRRWWCASNNGVENKATNMVAAYCSNMKGTWDGIWCRSADDVPLFMVKTDLRQFATDGHLPYCTSGRAIGITAATSENVANQMTWLNRANSEGFQNKLEVATHELQVKTSNAIAETKLRNQETAIKQQLDNNAEYIVASGIGTQVCKKNTPVNGAIEYVGYVEQIANGKIKISIAQARFTNSNRTLGGFTPTVIWDIPQNWYACQ